MKRKSQVTSILAKIFVPAFALFTLSNCSEEELTPERAVQPVAAATTGVENQQEPVLSLTIDGTFTEFVSTKECKTCTYIVPANATTIDGHAIGIKPGQAICLDAALKYGNLTFINVEGEENNPITIAYGVNKIPTVATETYTGED
jgi:hypothetical protein